MEKYHHYKKPGGHQKRTNRSGHLLNSILLFLHSRTIKKVCILKTHIQGKAQTPWMCVFTIHISQCPCNFVNLEVKCEVRLRDLEGHSVTFKDPCQRWSDIRRKQWRKKNNPWWWGFIDACKANQWLSIEGKAWEIELVIRPDTYELLKKNFLSRFYDFFSYVWCRCCLESRVLYAPKKHIVVRGSSTGRH